MPVLLTGGEGPVGRAAAQDLRRSGAEVRAFVDLDRMPRPDPGPLRRLGCKVALGALDDEGHLESAMEQVHTVLHLAGSPLDDPEAVVEAAATVVSAAIGAGVRRLVSLSWLGADEPRGSAWLEACAEVESLVEGAPLEGVVLRRSLTYGAGDPLIAALAAGAAPDGMADQWPLWAGDLASAVVVADRGRVEAASDLHVVVAVVGPQRVPAAELVAGLAAASEAHTGRGVGRPAVPAHAVVLLRRELPPPDGALGASGVPFEEGVRRLATGVA